MAWQRVDQPSAVGSAILREQERSVRRVDAIRLAGATGLLALYVVLDVVLGQAEWGAGAGVRDHPRARPRASPIHEGP